LIHFDSEMREQFRASVKAASPCRQTMATRAASVATAWLDAVSEGSERTFFAAALGCKAAGYNADLYGWVIKASRAIEAADALLKDVSAIDFQLPDLQLGEYFLLQRAMATGRRVQTHTPLAELERGLFATQIPCSQRAGFASVEVELNADGAHGPCGALSSRCDVAFVATMPTYLPPLLGPMEALSRRGESCTLLVPSQAIHEWPAMKQVPANCRVVAIESLLDQSHLAQLEWEQASMADVCERSLHALQRSMVFDGVSLWPLVRADLVHLARYYVPHVRVLRVAMAQWVRAAGVRTLVCARLRRATDTTMALAAREAGASICMLLHGHISSEPERTFVDGDFSIPHALCIWGEPQREVAVTKGVDSERITVTGNPAWDQSRSGMADARGTLASQLGCAATDRIVTLIGQADALPQLGKIIETAAATPGLILACRPHPGEEVTVYRRALSLLGNERTLLLDQQGPSLEALLAGSDAIVTLHSTVNLEALAHGTPVITVALDQLSSLHRLVDLPAYGLPLATSARVLESLFKQLVEAPQRWHDQVRGALIRARHAWGMDHPVPAAERVADRIQSCTHLAGASQAEAA
jgi:hypothetical protein